MNVAIHLIIPLFCCLWFISIPYAQQDVDTILSLEQIFHKPYIAGTRPTDPRISPDGKLILFRWDSTAHNKYRWWLMNSDGSSLQMIEDTLVSDIEWAPDSKRLACTRKGDIFLTDTSFRSYERITKTSAQEGGLVWSPHGSSIRLSQ